jgi:hypothetical protein
MKIYFIQQGKDGPVKIGISWEIKKRLRDISVSSPFNPVVLALIPGNREKEKQLHRKFKKEHLRGEWFKASDRLMEFIRTLPNNNISQSVKMDREKLFTPLEMAEYIKLSPNRVMSMARRREIPSFKIAGLTYFKPSQVEMWIEGLIKSQSVSQNPPQEKTQERKVLDFKR